MNLTIVLKTAQAKAGENSLPQLVLLHLVPGAIIALVFAALARVMAGQGWPASLALLVTWLVAGIPLLLGILYYQGFYRNGIFSLSGKLRNRKPMLLVQYLWLVPALLVWTAVSSTMLYFVSERLHQALFGWTPAWLNLSAFAENPASYSPEVIWAIVLLSAVLNIVVPTVEELYFRSYLMPRLRFGPIWSPLASAALFSLYHFWLPWDFLGRLVALLPVVYVVQWKQNVYISILVHVLLNTIGTIGLLVLVMK